MYIDNLQTTGVKDVFNRCRVKYSFNYLRAGLEFLLKQSSLAKISPKRIAVPAFICPIVPEVIRRCGFDVKLVDTDLRTFNMKIANFNDVGAVLICHTFGARRHVPEDIPVIEDCAHFFGKKLEGDFGLYSLSKQLPNVRGGYVVTKEKLPYEHLGEDRVSLLEVFMKISGPHRSAFNFLRSFTGLPKACPVSEEKWDILKASKIFTRDFESKQEVYEQLCGHFEKLELEEFFTKQEMPEGSQPFNFSLRLKEDNEVKRDKILLKLRRKGVFGDRLWYNAETNDLPNASLLARTVINLPLHPQVLVKLKHVL